MLSVQKSVSIVSVKPRLTRVGEPMPNPKTVTELLDALVKPTPTGLGLIDEKTFGWLIELARSSVRFSEAVDLQCRTSGHKVTCSCLVDAADNAHQKTISKIEGEL